VREIVHQADSRVPVEIIFDQSIGQIFVNRVAGNLEEMAASLISTEIAQQPDVKAWRSAFAQTLQTRLDAARQRNELVARERELQRQFGDVRRKLARLGQARDRRERRAEVLVSCAPGKTANVFDRLRGASPQERWIATTPRRRASRSRQALRVRVAAIGWR